MNELSSFEKYGEMAKSYMTKNREWMGLKDLSESEFTHVCEIARSILLSRDGILKGGSFVQAIINNDLRGAVNYADATCAKAIKSFVVLYQNCDSYNY